MKINSFIQYAPITKPAEASSAAASANKNQLKPVTSLPEFDKQPGLPSRLQPKEEKTYTTMAVGEEGSSLNDAFDKIKDHNITTMAVGEEGTSFTVPESLKDLKATTMAVGEEGGSLAEAIENFKDRRATTLAVGEEGGVNFSDLIKK